MNCSRPQRAVFGLMVVAVITIQAIAATPIMRWMLEHEVRGAAASWASYVFKQVDAGVDAHHTDTLSDSAVNLAGALEAAMRSGVIQEAVLTNNACGCAVSVDGSGLADPNTSIAQRLERFLAGDSSAPVTLPDGITPDEWSALLAAKVQPAPRIAFHESTEPGTPELAAETTFFQDINGARYGLTFVIDITSSAARLRLMMVMGGTILTLTFVGAAFVIARISSHSSRAMRLSETQARFLAEHDPMTGLLNRYGFSTRAEALLSRVTTQGKRAFLFQIDADKFKEINDLHGHSTGDRVIQALSEMLKGAFPAKALVGRLGGDEFAVLVAEDILDATIDAVMQDLPTGTEITSDDGEKLIEISTSIGRATFPKDAKTLGDLMKAADLALYDVKSAGRNGVGAYRRDMTRALERRHWELQGIREAIRTGHLVPYYQPLVNARTGRIEYVEALARWNHKTYGILTPNRFLHALEDPRVSTEITREMLVRVAHDLKVWQSLGHDFSVGINICESDLTDPDFPDFLHGTLATHGLSPTKLVMEVTETALTQANRGAARPVLETYREVGGPVALDDFGTGNSSITLLKDQPYSAVKIDKSFVRDLTWNDADVAIVRSIVQLSKDLGFRVVAEGIETAEQARLLRKLGIDLLQGFLYSHPLPANELLDLLSWASPPRPPADELRTAS